MTSANIARMQGDDYQARWFWIQACRLFDPASKVVRVATELDNVKSLDDVGVSYREGMLDEAGNPCLADYYQVKFHTTAADAITWRDLIDPAFIHASSVSLLQRLRDAQARYAPDGTGARFILYTPWPVHPDDPLAELVSEVDGRILWARLADGGPRSQGGEIRAAWKAHLGLETDGELQRVLAPMRLRRGPTLDEIGTYLNLSLAQAGLAPVEAGVLSNPYDDLIHKLLQAGENNFTREDIERICQREGLLKSTAAQPPSLSESSPQPEMPARVGGDSILIYGNVGPGASVGRGQVKAANISGGNIVVGSLSGIEGQIQFAELLAQLKEMLLKARDAGEIAEGRSGAIIQGIDAAATQVKTEKPPIRDRLVETLQTVANLVDQAIDAINAASGTALILLKALPVVSLLIRLANRLF